MSAIFLILIGILFIIMLVIEYRSEDDFCRPIKYQREIEKERAEDYEKNLEVINDWIDKNQDKIKNWEEK